MSTGRQLYIITRGCYTRRDGPERSIVDSSGKKTGTYKEHVHYSAGGKNEVYMDDAEADAFGRHRLKRLITKGVTTTESKELKGKTVPADGKIRKAKLEPVDDEGIDIAALIQEGEKAKTPKEKRDFRKAVIEADIIDEVPDRHGDIIDALKEAA